MKQIRLHKRLSSPSQSKPVQPKVQVIEDLGTFDCGAPNFSQEAIVAIDADGNPIYDD